MSIVRGFCIIPDQSQVKIFAYYFSDFYLFQRKISSLTGFVPIFLRFSVNSVMTLTNLCPSDADIQDSLIRFVSKPNSSKIFWVNANLRLV